MTESTQHTERPIFTDEAMEFEALM